MEIFTAYLSVGKGALVDGDLYFEHESEGHQLYLMLIESNMDKTNMICPLFTRKRAGGCEYSSYRH